MKPFNSPMLFFLLSCSLVSIAVDATITIGERHFQSMPAVFGKPFSLVGNYDTAHLQLLPDSPFLCKLAPENERHLRTKNETNHIVPTDGLPVAILVSRGACSFEEKARTAMSYGFISYVIVYDDRARAALVPMSATDPDDVTVGMMFVSHITGMQLRRMILDQPTNVTEEGGMIITMDARSPPLPPDYQQTQQWMLAAMAGFFTFMSCFGCLMVGIQMGYIPANGRIVMGRTGVHPSRSSRRLLTEAQVRRLPHEVYVKGEDEDHHHGCAICIDEYQDGDTLRVLPCSHAFHADCIVPWLTERQASCPLCKHDITRDDLLEEDEESRGSRGWFWSWGQRADRTMVPTEDEDSFETPLGSLSRRLEDHSPPVSPLSASGNDDDEGNVGALIPNEVS